MHIPADLLAFDGELRDELEAEAERRLCELSLYQFLQTAWPHFDPAEFKGGWHLEAICSHLEAVTRGDIRKLLINVPPRHAKTSAAAIAWPCWTWALERDANPRRGPGVRFLAGSYGANKARQDAVTARRLIGSTWYQRLWGDRVQIATDRDNQEQYDTLAGGSRISTGIAESLGKGGLIRILDDPHKTDEVESAEVLASVIRAYREVWTTRTNDAEQGAQVIIMQRLGEGDLSGEVLAEGGWTHLSLPAEYDRRRRPPLSQIGFFDPRKRDGEPLWPEKFSVEWLAEQAKLIGPYAYAGQYQQAPSPRGGGIIKREWWQTWPPAGDEASWEYEKPGPDGRPITVQILPSLTNVVVGIDMAYLQKEENDFCACTAWGRFLDRTNRPKIMLTEAWQARLNLRELAVRTIETCARRKADTLLIGVSGGAGHLLAQEVRRLMRKEEWSIVVDAERLDKAARLHATVPLFAGGLIYAPDPTVAKRKWVNMVIDQISAFPRAKNDDIVDTASMCLGWMRRVGLAQLTVEAADEETEMLRFRGNAPGVAEAYGVG